MLVKREALERDSERLATRLRFPACANRPRQETSTIAPPAVSIAACSTS